MFTCPVSTFAHTSFSPEKRAEAQTQYLNDALKAIDAEVTRLAADPKAQPIDPAIIDQMKSRHAAAYQAYWSSLSRTASPMITGPANFPTNRNRKALDAAAKRYENIETHYKAITKRLIKLAYPTRPRWRPHPLKRPRSGGQA